MQTTPSFYYLTETSELCRAFALIRELRPHLTDSSAFAAQMVRQFEQHYRLLSAQLDGEMVGLIGFREQENLLYGRFIYVDDLIVANAQRHAGIGAQLLAAARHVAQDAGCAHLVLDTGLHMPLAQRFYFREGLLAKGMHFVQPLARENSQHG